MRALALGLLMLIAPSLAFAAVDPADKEAAIKYEQAVQAGNKLFRESNSRMQGLLLGLTAKDVKEVAAPADATAALDDYEKAIAGFQAKLKDVPPPSGEAGAAYAKAVDAYLAHLSSLAKDDYRQIIASLERPAGTPEEKAALVAPLLAKASQTQRSVLTVSTARKAYLKAYEISPADLAAASGVPAAAPAAEGPAALYATIREGEQAFRDSMQSVQRKLLPKLLLGGEIEPAEVATTFAEIQAALDKFEAHVAAAKVPDDPESQAYAESAKKLIAATKKVDFAAVAKLFTDPDLSAEEKQAQLIKTMTSLESGIKEELKAFNLAKAAIRKKHGIVEPGEAAQTPPM